MSFLVRDFMTKGVRSVDPDTDLRTIRALFENAPFHHLLVVEKGRLLGVISDRDLLKAISPFAQTINERPQDAHTLNRKAHQVMTRKLVVVHSEDPIELAAQLLVEKSISCLPVATPEMQVEGILTWRDLLKGYVLSLKRSVHREDKL